MSPERPVDAGAGAPGRDKPRVIALVLAAGRGRRFGSDKRRAQLADGRQLLCATVESVRPHFSETFVVLRQEDSVQALALPSGVKVLHAVHARQGIGASMADAVRTLHDVDCDAVAIVLGDMPWVAPQTLRALIERAAAGRIVRPVQGGRGGHPVLFGRDFLTALSALGQDEGARGVLATYRHCVEEVEVDDPGIWRDVDRPDDLQ